MDHLLMHITVGQENTAKTQKFTILEVSPILYWLTMSTNLNGNWLYTPIQISMQLVMKAPIPLGYWIGIFLMTLVSMLDQNKQLQKMYTNCPLILMDVTPTMNTTVLMVHGEYVRFWRPWSSSLTVFSLLLKPFHHLFLLLV